MAKTQRTPGFLSWKESGARLTIRQRQGDVSVLVSVDLGRISYEEARKKAWLHAVPLLSGGRILQRAA